jgi:hypothetical protein
MSEIIERLLKRNLHEVFGERDGERRRAAIVELYTDDCIFSDHFGHNIGRAALDAAVASLQAKLPTYVIADLGPGQSLTDSGRLLWRFGPPEEPARLTGVDFILVRGNRIAALYVFLDGPTPAPS